ncbi:MAG: DMT family transporter [Rhodospirillales bacterium]|nr:DMT family transporter [Rhodospirillales bacterium]
MSLPASMAGGAAAVRSRAVARFDGMSPVARAIFWMIASGVLFAFLNTIQKFLTHRLHPPEVVCLRYLVGSCILLPLAIRAGWEAYRPRRPGLHALRGVFHTGGSLIWFTVLPHVTLAETSAIGFTGPIFMMIGAALFLGERMYLARWAATLGAFGGVLIVLWPGLRHSDLGNTYAFWLLLSSPLMAVSFLVSKALTKYERPDAIVFWLGIMLGVFTIPFAIWSVDWSAAGPVFAVVWRWPTPVEWGLLATCGVIGSTAHYCLTRCYHIADVGAVQSVRFLDLLWASLLGFVVFSNVPTVWTLTGGSVICAATIWIARRESRRRPAPAS